MKNDNKGHRKTIIIRGGPFIVQKYEKLDNIISKHYAYGILYELAMCDEAQKLEQQWSYN